MEIPIPGKDGLYIETGPWSFDVFFDVQSSDAAGEFDTPWRLYDVTVISCYIMV